MPSGTPQGQTPFWTPAKIALAVELWRLGVPTREIGRRLGCTANMVIGWINRNRIQYRLAPRPRIGRPR